MGRVSSEQLVDEYFTKDSVVTRCSILDILKRRAELGDISANEALDKIYIIELYTS